MKMRRSLEKSKKIKDNIIKSYLDDGYLLKSVTEKRNKFVIQMENENHYLIIEVYKYYAMQTDKYSKFNEEGIPTHNAKGGELSKEQFNKLKKDFQKHEKNHLKWVEQQKNKKEKKEKEDKKEDKKEEHKEEQK